MIRCMYVFQDSNNEKYARTIAKELDVDLYPVNSTGYGEEDFAVITRWAENNYMDAIIAHGRDYRKLERMSLEIPVFPIYHSSWENLKILLALKRRLGERASQPLKIGLASHYPIPQDREVLTHIFGWDIHNTIIPQNDDLEEFFRNLKAEGYEVIVCGEMYVPAVKKSGMLGFYEPNIISYASLKEGFEMAVRMAQFQVQLKNRTRELKLMMDHSFEAILMLAADGAITVYNKAVENLLLESTGEIRGRYLTEVFPEMSSDLLDQVLSGGSDVYGQIVTLNNKNCVVNITKVKKDKNVDSLLIHISELGQLEKMEAHAKDELYSKGHTAKYHLEDILGESEEIREMKRRALHFAKYNANILLMGETGTGKEYFAQGIHNESLRKNKPFVAINCGAIPLNLLESELFGYVDGAFTGASRKGKKGLIEVADGGTLFLDEISEMDLYGQTRLLRVLEERAVSRIGDDTIRPVDIRVIAASNKNLLKRVEEGKFREDLYYRLNVLTLRIPPMRERGQDVLILAESFLKRFGERYKKNLVLSDEAKRVLLWFPWKGNARQLRNFCEQLVIIANKSEVEGGYLRKLIEDTYLMEVEKPKEAEQREQEENDGEPMIFLPDDTERERIIKALNQAHGRRQGAADKLGISKSSLWRKMKKYGISENY
ncbi:sigma 54-interacting transcriptional regulator [Cuneatibacter sp. NSJ-177]|uniref:sigma 54-interacting transcriptional regulator n=1 Tax=Cuneatibacter sp. NSJ-177 TaxID=2931401 RepID=UPI001FD041FA|nr:sigma 54-interacting transcriptional regulator [Cuneatibacter sp. NSJ-177]MCJ7834313.1 sigma 54-interacting transcriptional regulator [Cuneatibacter sp. NSJ-177]